MCFSMLLFNHVLSHPLLLRIFLFLVSLIVTWHAYWCYHHPFCLNCYFFDICQHYIVPHCHSHHILNILWHPLMSFVILATTWIWMRCPLNHKRLSQTKLIEGTLFKMSYMSTQCPNDIPRRSEVGNLGLQSSYVVMSTLLFIFLIVICHVLEVA